MIRKPHIIVAGILDTKGTEVAFIADRVRAAGGEPIVLELSLKHEVGWADVSLTDLLAKADRNLCELDSMLRTDVAEIIAGAAIEVVREKRAQGFVHGMIAFGGSTGTSMATRIMRTLPIGVPKLMLSTMSSGDCSSYVGTRDVAMLYPIAEAGLNAVTRRILNYAAAGIVAMASAPDLPSAHTKPMIGCMMLGATTRCVLRASQFFTERGFEVMINHAVGSGGKSMEELITDGYIAGVLDISTHEVADFLLGGILSAGPDRLTAAAKKGIPQVIAPGGLDMIVFGPPETVPPRLVNEAGRGIPGRSIRIHNPALTIVGTTPDEAFTIGRYMAEKLNSTKGSTALCIPMRGWTAYDIAAPDPNLGWPGPGPGPFWVPSPDKPEWSLRAQRFLDGLYGRIDRAKPDLAVMEIDRHINDYEFADLIAGLLLQMLSGVWNKEQPIKTLEA
jgi:uncharacterized protein (UPF0261 family)